MNLKKIELRRHVSLRRFTTIKIGGEADSFLIAHSIEDLCEIIQDTGKDFYLLGGGSNLLVSDYLIQKPVIKLGQGFNFIRNDADLIEVGAATPLSNIFNFCLKNKLGGLENLAGIPATLGGLLVMNASAFGREISCFLQAVEIMDREGVIKKVKREEIAFAYRFSSLKDYIILRAWFNLPRQDHLKERIASYLKARLKTQDFSFPSCGCIFKNHPTSPAGFLIESCGLKGLKHNDAQVSDVHANFIINLGNASFGDVDYLITVIKDKVHAKFGIHLEEEVERWS
jgi:UDP-N-acetylmuramate dehydrogenase